MTYEFGPYRLDAAQRLLTRGEETVVLAPKTFDLLLILVESRGRVLTKKELMNALWPDTFVDEANLPFQISALRKALGEEGAEWIDTLPKHGYRFAATVKKIGGDGAGSAASEALRSRWTLRRLAPWLIAGVTTLVAVTVVVLHLSQPPPAERTVRFSVSPPGEGDIVRLGPACRVPGRREARFRRGRARRAHSALGSHARFPHGGTGSGYGRRGFCILVARQPLPRVLRGRETQENRLARRPSPNAL
jgi:DNA-binding winged helix-turn-helix (wHTH) protein